MRAPASVTAPRCEGFDQGQAFGESEHTQTLARVSRACNPIVLDYGVLLIETPTLETYQDLYEIEVPLGVRSYVLRLSWSGTLWYVDVLLANTLEPLALGAPLTLYRPVLLYCTHPERPQGEIMAISETPDWSEGSREDLGARMRLVYVPRA